MEFVCFLLLQLANKLGLQEKHWYGGKELIENHSVCI
jgi:hypothetical protein